MACNECGSILDGKHAPYCRFYVWPLPQPYAPVGWICPRCGRGNAPYSMTCWCIPITGTIVTWGNNGDAA